MKKLLVVALLAAPALALAQAQAYKWVDEYGQVHYTQEPPKKGKYEPARPAPPPSLAPNQESINKALDQSIKDAPTKKEEAEQAAAVQAQKQQECKSAQDQLSYMEASTARRMTTTDDKGNVSRVTDEQYEQRHNQLQQVVRDKCA